MMLQRARSTAAGGLFGPVPFDGYPYLVTRIGRTALRHLAVVPADWSRALLVELARRQAEVNQLETCLCLGPRDVVYVVPDREPANATHVPTGIAVVDRLVVAGRLEPTPALLARQAALRAYADAQRFTGHLVGDGLEGGRPATPEDVVRLTGRGDGGVPGDLPPGLHRCEACGRARGEALARAGGVRGDLTPHVVDVHCRCANRNRCAGCGEPLAGERLSAWHWDDERAGAWYLAAYCCLSHRCR